MASIFKSVWIGLTLIGSGFWALGQAPEASPPPKPEPVVREVSPGIFTIGSVKLDKAVRTVQFPALLNMEDSIVEYLLVTDRGKIHESVLRTEVEPYHIHLAMLLLGAKGSGTNTFPEGKPAEIPGEKLQIEVSWEGTQGLVKVPAERLVWNRQEKKPMANGPWVYTGSLLVEGTFVAQQEGSVISLIVDQSALINNPRLGAENDELWLVNTNGLPPLNTPVQVNLRLGDRAPLEKK